MRFKAVTLGFVLAGTALGSAALNLGRARGAAWIGQPLELVVQVQVDAGQVDGALCAEADVFHGDSRQENSRVQIQVEPSGQPDTFNLKILSSALIDEPVVTVYLRAGCSQKYSRKFVLLADFPSETTSVQGRTVVAVAPVVPTVIPAESSQLGGVSNAPVRATTNSDVTAKAETKTAKPTATSAEPPQKKESIAKPVKAEKPTEVSAPPAKAAGSGKARLRLDPIETLAERVKSLESTTTATSVQDDVARDAQRMQQLQADLRSLLDQAVKNEASLVAMRERLEKAESERVPLAMVYGLIALVVLCFGGLAYLWSRRGKIGAWEGRDNLAQLPSVGGTAVSTHPEALAESPIDEAQVQVSEIDVDLESFGELKGHQVLSVEQVTKSKHRNFNADSLIDLRQQADFLAKLGKVDDALEVLEAGIRKNPEESPFLFLDLLAIANNFSRKTDFRQFREEFNQVFNATVQDFALFRDEGRNLEAYPALLDHINSQWESPRVLDVIEACIMRNPEASESDPFDLAAFRELLSMHIAASERHHIHG